MLKRLLPASEFSKNFYALFTGTALAQAIPILISPLLTRLFTPSEFGLLAIYVSISSLIAIVATGRYEMAIVLPKDNKNAYSLLVLSVMMAIAVSTLCFPLLYWQKPNLIEWYNEPNIEQWWYIIPFTVLLTGFYQAFNYYATRNKKFSRISSSKISDSVINNAVKIFSGYKLYGVFGLILGNLVGHIVACLALLKIAWDKQLWKEVWSDKSNILTQGRKYSDFLKINTVHAFSDVLQATLLIFIISTYFGSVALGFFAFTLRIIKTPMSLIGGSLTQVFYQKISVNYSEGGDISRLVKKMVKNLFYISLPVFTIVMVFGPGLFAFIFGAEWRVAGEFAQILSPWMLLGFVATTISQVPNIVNKQKENFIISLAGHILLLGSILYGSLVANDIKQGLLLITITQVLFLLYVIRWIIRISHKTTT